MLASLIIFLITFSSTVFISRATSEAEWMAIPPSYTEKYDSDGDGYQDSHKVQIDADTDHDTGGGSITVHAIGYMYDRDDPSQTLLDYEEVDWEIRAPGHVNQLEWSPEMHFNIPDGWVPCGSTPYVKGRTYIYLYDDEWNLEQNGDYEYAPWEIHHNIYPPGYASQTTLYYDDGDAEYGLATSSLPHYKAVRFHTPTAEAYGLKYVNYYIYSSPSSFELQIRDASAQIIYSGTVTPTEVGWFIVDLTSEGIYVQGDFWVGMKYLSVGQPELGCDTSSPDGESGEGSSFPTTPNISSLDYMIRVILGPSQPQLDVELTSPPSPPNGGVVTSSPVELMARVTSSGSLVQDALVRFYVEGVGEVGSDYSDSSGYGSIDYYPSAGTNVWYARAEKTGYNSGESDHWSFTYNEPDFNIYANPSSLSIEQDSSGTTTVYVDSLNGFDADVSLSVSNLPSGVSYSYSKNPVHPPPDGQDSSTLTLSVSFDVARGTYYPRVVGTSGTITHDFEMELEITSVEVTWEIVDELDNRVTPGDHVNYLIYINNHMQIEMTNTQVTLTASTGTPIGFKINILEYADTHTQNYDPIPAGGSEAKSWYLQVWKTVDTPFYPGEDIPRGNILDPVPIGGFEVTIDVEWEDENGFHQISESLPITVEYPDFGPPPSGYEHYVEGSEYYHPDDPTVRYAASKAVAHFGTAADTTGLTWLSVYHWIIAYFKNSLTPFHTRWTDKEILLKMQQGKRCGQCAQYATITVSLLRSVGIAARLVNGQLNANFPSWKWPWRRHAWTEAYVDSKWIHIDPAMGIYDTDEPFEKYVKLPWCNSVQAAAMKVTDCLEWKPWTMPWDLPCYEEHWEDVSSKYSPPSLEITGTFVVIEEDAHFLGLDLYDSLGRHIRVNYETNSTVISIPDACYVIDYNFSFIFIPVNITNFDVIVDAKYAEQPVETYNLTAFLAVNSTIMNQTSYQSTINANDTEGYHAQIVNETMEFTPGIHSITITNIVASKTIVGQGYIVSINITIQNQGDFTESFNVTVFYDDTAITLPDGKNHTTTTLTSGNSTTITITWNTTGIAIGNYVISAYAWPVPGETETVDNLYVDGTVQIVLLVIEGPYYTWNGIEYWIVQFGKRPIRLISNY